MTKKTAFNILILVVVTAIALVVYLVFFQKEDVVTNPTSKNNNLPVASNFFPESENTNTNTTDNNQNNQNNNQQNIPTLRQISSNPVAGFFTYDKESTSTVATLPIVSEEGETIGYNEEEIKKTETFYIFANRSNGNILETSSETLNLDRLTNTTIPKVYEAYFSDEQNVVFRYLDEDENVVSSFIKLKKEEQTGTTTPMDNVFWSLENKELPKNIKNVLVSNSGLIFYTTETTSGLLGNVFDNKTSDTKNVVFESEIKHLNFFWASDDNLFFSTKPSANGENYLFKHNFNTNTTSKVLGAGKGFTFIPNKTADFILFSETKNNGLSSFIYNTLSGDFYELGVKTIVGDKCVWSSKEEGFVYCAVPKTLGSNQPTSWYQGESSFSDELYKIDTVSGIKEKIEGLEGDFDIINPQLSEKENYFIFINKKDLTLWSLNITN